MNKSIFPLLALLLILSIGMAWYYFSDGQVQKRAVQASLTRFSEAVATKDRAKISAALGELLTPDAKIRLEVYFFSVTGGRPTTAQDFDKAGFIRFIDTTLYPLTDYGHTPTLVSLDTTTGSIEFTSSEWADGANMMGGISLNMRYGSSTSCKGIRAMEAGVAKLKEASCTLQFRQVPKPGQEGKFLSQKGLNNLLGTAPPVAP